MSAKTTTTVVSADETLHTPNIGVFFSYKLFLKVIKLQLLSVYLGLRCVPHHC